MLLVVTIVVAGAARRSALGAVLAVLLATGVASDFRLDPYPEGGWDQTHACIQQATACTIPIWPRDYDVHWPGADGTYELPSHDDP
jgi:hypothetical protein